MSAAKVAKKKTKSVLSHDEFVDASIRLARKHGLSKLTMRLLADDLGVSPMALYYYIPDKNSLLAYTVDAILGTIKYPKLRAESNWKTQFLAVHKAGQDATLGFSDLDSLLYDTPLTPNGARLINTYLSILENAGFTPNEALRAYGVVHSHFLGRSRLMRARMGVTTTIHVAGMDADGEKLRHRLVRLGTPEQQKYALMTILDALDLQLQSKLVRKLTKPPAVVRAASKP